MIHLFLLLSRLILIVLTLKSRTLRICFSSVVHKVEKVDYYLVIYLNLVLCV